MLPRHLACQGSASASALCKQGSSVPALLPQTRAPKSQPPGGLMPCLGFQHARLPRVRGCRLLPVATRRAPGFGKGFVAFHKEVPVCRQQLIQTFACDRLGSLCKLCRRRAGSNRLRTEQPPQTAPRGGRDGWTVGRAVRLCPAMGHAAPLQRGNGAAWGARRVPAAPCPCYTPRPWGSRRLTAGSTASAPVREGLMLWRRVPYGRER